MDVLAYLDGPAAELAFRRGWTHGIPALIVLPFLLTAAMLLLDRGVRRLGRAALPSGVAPAELLRLSAVAILTHPILDTLNVYGVRWLMPLRGDWFYGDTLFIVDPWMWVILGTGVALSGTRRSARGVRRDGVRWARTALVVTTGYAAGMLLLGLAARRLARHELELDGRRVDRLMVAPRPVTLLTRQVVAVQGDTYRLASFRWFGRPHVALAAGRTTPRPSPDDPALVAARATPLGRRFLGWARFPAVQVEASSSGGSLIHLMDLRYADRPGAGFGTVTIAVSSPPSAFRAPAHSPRSPSTPAAPVRGTVPGPISWK